MKHTRGYVNSGDQSSALDDDIAKFNYTFELPLCIEVVIVFLSLIKKDGPAKH